MVKVIGTPGFFLRGGELVQAQLLTGFVDLIGDSCEGLD